MLKILKKTHLRINSVTSKEFGSLTKRPFNSKLDNSKIIKKFGIKLPNWKESLLRFIYEKKISKNTIETTETFPDLKNLLII